MFIAATDCDSYILFLVLPIMAVWSERMAGFWESVSHH